MAKLKTIFICQECGYESAKWLGKCPACNEWNTFAEETQMPISKETSTAAAKAISLNEVNVVDEQRYKTGIEEMDRVLGGGIVKGSLVLIGGDPGIGKSTLLLQVCKSVNLGLKVLYISGEESTRQIKMRADRLEVDSQNIFIISETNLDIILATINEEKPNIVIIDSIQTIFSPDVTSAPGSVSQVRESTAKLMKMAKTKNISTLIVGHVTKEGAIAGPRVLEHMVDTVLYFEGERHLSFRILRAVKNRFGSTNEMGVFEMKDIGLVEVTNPSELFLSGRPENAPGSVIISTIEGSRSMLVEVQALVAQSNFGMPRRMATGIDYNRVIMLMAVLEKRVGMQLQNFDGYVNVIGGMKIEETAADLGVISAIASSFRNKPISSDMVILGEVGLAGEVRSISYVEKRIIEAKKLGFKTCIIPKSNFKGLKIPDGIEVIGVNSVSEAANIIFNK
jgi:DNA repair protein RadA/Sms